MKKILVLALAVVMVLGVVAFAACAQPQTVVGECHYENAWSPDAPHYGVKVEVVVKGNTIVSVSLVDCDYVRTSGTWTEGQNEGDLGYDKTEAAYDDYLKQFVGKTVDQVKAYVATATKDGQSVGEGAPYIAGATQSSARIIVAIQDALSKLA